MSSVSKLKKNQLLIKRAKKFLDFRDLFPASKIDARKPLTPYQSRKINATLRDLEKLAGGPEHLERDFIPLPRSKSRAQFSKQTNVPAATRGVLIPGGSKVNRQVRFKQGALHYKRGVGETLYRFYPLDAESERRLIESAKEAIKNLRPHNEFLSIATYGGEVKNTKRKTDAMRRRDYMTREEVEEKYGEYGEAEELERGMLEELQALYNKYAQMSANGERRRTFDSRGRLIKDRGIAAHPSKWGLGLLGG